MYRCVVKAQLPLHIIHALIDTHPDRETETHGQTGRSACTQAHTQRDIHRDRDTRRHIVTDS